MFTMPELLTAVDLAMSLPIIIWENGGFKQIQDDMDAVGVTRVGVEASNRALFLWQRLVIVSIYVDTKGKVYSWIKKSF